MLHVSLNQIKIIAEKSDLNQWSMIWSWFRYHLKMIFWLDLYHFFATFLIWFKSFFCRNFTILWLLISVTVNITQYRYWIDTLKSEVIQQLWCLMQLGYQISCFCRKCFAIFSLPGRAKTAAFLFLNHLRSSLLSSPLSPSITPTLFHSKLQTYLFKKSFQPWPNPSIRLPLAIRTLDCSMVSFFLLTF